MKEIHGGECLDTQDCGTAEWGPNEGLLVEMTSQPFHNIIALTPNHTVKMQLCNQI